MLKRQRLGNVVLFVIREKKTDTRLLNLTSLRRSWQSRWISRKLPYGVQILKNTNYAMTFFNTLRTILVPPSAKPINAVEQQHNQSTGSGEAVGHETKNMTHIISALCAMRILTEDKNKRTSCSTLEVQCRVGDDECYPR